MQLAVDADEFANRRAIEFGNLALRLVPTGVLADTCPFENWQVDVLPRQFMSRDLYRQCDVTVHRIVDSADRTVVDFVPAQLEVEPAMMPSRTFWPGATTALALSEAARIKSKPGGSKAAASSSEAPGIAEPLSLHAPIANHDVEVDEYGEPIDNPGVRDGGLVQDPTLHCFDELFNDVALFEEWEEHPPKVSQSINLPQCAATVEMCICVAFIVTFWMCL